VLYLIFINKGQNLSKYQFFQKFKQLKIIIGSMAGMSRDKVGAADVAGFMKVVSILKPTNVKVIAAMGMVRNSAGKDAYVADEIITSR
jgi:leucyl aminopeptidase